MELEKTKMKARVLLFVAAFVWGCATSSFAAGVETAATHALLVDEGTGTVLLAKNADVKMPTSSMSKTLTLYLVFEALKAGHIKLDDEMPVSERAWKMEGSRMFLK